MGVIPWVAKIGDYAVEKHELPRSSGQAYIPLTDPRAFVIHTTEGSTVSGAISTLGAKFAGPHFVLGEDRIVQTRPLTAQAATLVDNGINNFHPNSIGWQVECVGIAHSDLRLHRLTPPSWEPLVALTRFMHEELGVPLRRPDGWGDKLSGTVANDNPRRKTRIACTFHGLLGHVDVPDQATTWHYDPGSLDYTALIAQASEGEDEMDARLDDYWDGQDDCEAAFRASDWKDPGAPPDAKSRPYKRGWNGRRIELTRPAPGTAGALPVHDHSGNSSGGVVTVSIGEPARVLKGTTTA